MLIGDNMFKILWEAINVYLEKLFLNFSVQKSGTEDRDSKVLVGGRDLGKFLILVFP